MAQVLAVQGDVRHGFVFKNNFKHDFGRITGIAATTKGNILLCDYDRKSLFLVDLKGDLLNILNLDSEPFDVAITNQNIGYITQPITESILQMDPDRMIILHRVKSNDVCTPGICVSAVSNSEMDTPNNVPCYFGVKHNGNVHAYPVNGYNINFRAININVIGISDWAIDPLVVRFHAVRQGALFSCIGGQSYIKNTKHYFGYAQKKEEYIINIESMDTPTDICSDNNGHVYVSGQGSNNIHRMTQEGKVLDIPLERRHGIIKPVALCFNQNHTKLYIANQWGKYVLVFDVI